MRETDQGQGSIKVLIFFHCGTERRTAPSVEDLIELARVIQPNDFARVSSLPLTTDIAPQPNVRC
jgi:hypothetical protein